MTHLINAFLHKYKSFAGLIMLHSPLLPVPAQPQDTLMTLILRKTSILPDYVGYVIANIFYKFLPYDTLPPLKDCGDIPTMELWHRVKIERKYIYTKLDHRLHMQPKSVWSDLPQSSSLLKIIFQIILYLYLQALNSRPTAAPCRKTFILPDYIAS